MGKSPRYADTTWNRNADLHHLLATSATESATEMDTLATFSATVATPATDPIISPPAPIEEAPIDDEPGFVASTTLEEVERVFSPPRSALAFLEMVQEYMTAHPEDRLVKKVRRHLPANPEWNGTLPTSGDKRGGGWSGAWKDFATLLEKASG
ncbi:hypothetical protein ES703_22096 [subsurface metagenome]